MAASITSEMRSKEAQLQILPDLNALEFITSRRSMIHSVEHL